MPISSSSKSLSEWTAGCVAASQIRLFGIDLGVGVFLKRRRLEQIS